MSEQLTIDLPDPIAAEIRSAVEAGTYESTDEAIRDALDLWLARQNEDRERLRAAWDAGKASGLHGPMDFEELRREAHARLAAIKAGGG